MSDAGQPRSNSRSGIDWLDLGIMYKDTVSATLDEDLYVSVTNL